jgi:hypothetical protein
LACEGEGHPCMPDELQDTSNNNNGLKSYHGFRGI